MKALSLTQPWASLVIDGRKKVETRDWRTSYRGPLAIHATREADYDAGEEFGYDAVPLRAILGTVELVECVVFTPMFKPVEIFGEEEMRYGDFEVGRYGWVLTAVRKFPEPITCNGKPGLWDWNPSLIEAANI